MKEKTAVFNGTFRAAASESDPDQLHLRFIFTDFLPNRNKQGVPAEEADNVIRTGLHKPVKISFASRKPKGHLGAFPIGPILSLEKSEDKIVGEAVVWRSEFPDVAQFLETASASEGGVQFSWELLFKDSNLDDNGTQWLRDISTKGITIVDTPAYQGRTPLLAIAEDYLMEETQKRVEELAVQVAELQNAVAEKDTKITELQTAVAELTTERDGLKAQAEELTQFKAQAEKAQAEAELLNTRKGKMAEAGIDETVFEKRKDMILGMAEEAFEAYVEDLATVAKPAKKAEASADKKVIPDPVNSGGTQTITLKDMGQALRQSRGK